MQYHVFISYRRSGAEDMARLLWERLKADGYCPFLDIEQMRSGKFNEQLYERIAECEDFVIVLPPKALDRCHDEEDWVRQEIQEALRLKKNIIPFMLRGFSFPTDIPESIKDIKYFQGIPASSDYFDSTMDKLKALLVYQPEKDSELQVENHPKKKIQIWNKIYEVDDSVTREDIIAANKAARVQRGKEIFGILLICVAASVISYVINLLTRDYTNQILDSWFYRNSEKTITSISVHNPALLFLVACITFLPCNYLFIKGREIESISLKILSILIYILFMLTLHLVPVIFIVVVMTMVAIGLLRGMMGI